MNHEKLIEHFVQNPLEVTNPKGSRFMVMDNGAELPASFALMATQAKKRVALRIAGGCAGMLDDDKRYMAEFLLIALDGFQGLCSGGSTRELDAEGKTDLMVTDIPGLIATANFGCVALGTAPRTASMRLQNDSQLYVSKYAIANPAYAGNLFVQNGPERNNGWDGDLAVYFEMFEYLLDYANFTQAGLVSWNGGGVTRKEIIGSASRGWQTIVIAGSGRISDEIAEKVLSQDEELIKEIGRNGRMPTVVDSNNPISLREALIESGFFN